MLPPAMFDHPLRRNAPLRPLSTHLIPTLMAPCEVLPMAIASCSSPNEGDFVRHYDGFSHVAGKCTFKAHPLHTLIRVPSPHFPSIVLGF